MFKITSTDISADTSRESLNCMEVWGGNCPSDNCLRRPGLDIWIRCLSQQGADAGGGDLHLLSSCASGRITRMLLADVCAIGPMFSKIAGELRDLMKQNINSIQQARIVSDVSLRLEEASHRGGFASTLISTYFAPTGSFSLCNAGHPPPLLFRSSRAEWSVLKQVPADVESVEVPSGVVHPDEYHHLKTKLSFGDMVLSYSNVLTECRDADGQTIGLHGLLSRARGLDYRRPEDIPSALLGQLRDEHPENLSAEDATVLLCRATESRVGWRDNLVAPFRLLRSVSDKTNL